MNKHSKIIVTGGAGFIGSNLCEYLYSKVGCSIWSLDNYSTGSTQNHIDNVTYIKGETSEIDNLIDFKPDYLFHFGEYSRVEQSFEDIEKVWDYNIGSILRILQFCIKNDTKIIYSGSSTKFGDAGIGRDQSPYAFTKATNSDLVKNFGAWFDLNYAIVYFYNAYGKREISNGKYATLIGIYKENTIKNDPLKIVLPGTQKRNFTHIDDITSALEIVAKKGKGDGFGIGSDRAYTVREIAEMFGGTVQEISERKGNRMDAEVVTEKTKKLGWTHKKCIKEHIKTFLEKNNITNR